MKKKIILALVLAAVAAVAVPSFANLHSHKIEAKEGNYTCNAYDGTGRSAGPGGKGTGNMKCWQCKGSGFVGGY